MTRVAKRGRTTATESPVLSDRAARLRMAQHLCSVLTSQIVEYGQTHQPANMRMRRQDSDGFPLVIRGANYACRLVRARQTPMHMNLNPSAWAPGGSVISLPASNALRLFVVPESHLQMRSVGESVWLYANTELVLFDAGLGQLVAVIEAETGTLLLPQPVDDTED